MKKKYAIILAFLAVALLFVPNGLYAQDNLVTIESIVTDEEGNPVENAELYSNTAYTKTDFTGRFSIKMEPGSSLVIEAKGFEDMILKLDEVANMVKITVKKVRFMYERDDMVDLAFRKAYKGNVVGAVSVVNANEVNYLDNTIYAGDALTGRTLGMLGSNTIRGIGIGLNIADITGSGLNAGNALFVVDGLPRDIESLRLAEIDHITVLKDVNAAILYGSAAVNGVVLITTKRGQAYKSTSGVSANYGISAPRALPDYLNSADYMTYYNQARVNDGLAPSFSDSLIQNFRSGNKYRYPSVDYYSSDYLNSFRSYFDLMSEFSGGNDVAKFYSNIGWYSAGSIIDFGQAQNARNNVFNVRANVDLKINDWIKTSIDGSSIFANNKSQRGNYWTAASTNRPHEFSPLLPINLIDPKNSLLLGRKNDVNGEYILGGNASFITNAIADTYAAGQFENIARKFSFNNRIDFDLKSITEGLSFHTNLSFDYFTRFTQTVANEYSVYEPVWKVGEDSITSLIQHGKDARPGTQTVGGTFFSRRLGFYGMFSYDRIFNNLHHFTGSLIGYSTYFKEQLVFQGLKQSHIGLQASYVYDQKYMVDFSSAYVHSVKLAPGNRGGFSPSLGFAWMISQEDFLSSAKAIDILKLRLSGGVINSDFPIGGYFYYDNRYTTSGSYAWNEGGRSRSGVMSSWPSNPNLGYAKRNEVNLGLEGLFFNRLLGFEANLFYDVYNNLITRPATRYPSFYNDFIPYENFGAEEYKGIELGLSLNKSVGEWNFYLSTNILAVTSERTKVDEVYVNDYQYRQGRPSDATFGLEALGLFQDQAEIESSPYQTFGTVRPGDIKYKDQNGDGIIDANDEVYLRRFQAPVSAGLELKISYKDLTLYALGDGRSGSETFMEGNYYWVDGNKKYTDVVLGAWTPETKATATYPRLSSGTNSNNHRRSSYWLYNNDYFHIRKVQLTWNAPQGVANALQMKKLNIFLDGSDIYQFAKNRKIREIRVGNEPLSRTFSIGVRANF
jgi:TonB-linked SusC/RagA family outer membrane protein